MILGTFGIYKRLIKFYPRIKLQTQHAKEKADILGIMARAEHEFQEVEADARHEYSSVKDDVKNKVSLFSFRISRKSTLSEFSWKVQ